MFSVGFAFATTTYQYNDLHRLTWVERADGTVDDIDSFLFSEDYGRNN